LAETAFNLAPPFLGAVSNFTPKVHRPSILQNGYFGASLSIFLTKHSFLKAKVLPNYDRFMAKRPQAIGNLSAIDGV